MDKQLNSAFITYDIGIDSFIAHIGQSKVAINCKDITREENILLSNNNCTLDQAKRIKEILEET